MHSITESDGVPSDPYEVLCHMVALIIEGRTPLHIYKGIGALTASGSEAIGKPAKPYREGPHCPNFMKCYNKESANGHKCSENVICLRFGKLKQHLLHLHEKSVPVCVEVSLGPDCLCGELRSQSTLVSVTPSKRDILLERWTINVSSKRVHEPSQMSVMNLYQAVRSLLHFSQLTAWYMRNNGMKPANVIYRVGVPGDSPFPSEENFIKHDFPIADINKETSIKMSVNSIPRIESIPSVYCPQHSCGNMDDGQGILHQDSKDFSRINKDKKYLGQGTKLGMDEKEEVADNNLPLKFQGVRKKIYKSPEIKTKNRISYFGTTPSIGMDPSINIDACEDLEYLDTIAADKQSSGKSVLGMYASGKAYPSDSLKNLNLTSESCVAKHHNVRSRTPQFTSDLLKLNYDSECTNFYSYNLIDEELVQPKLDAVSSSFDAASFRKRDADPDILWTGEKSDLPNRKFDNLISCTDNDFDLVDDRMQISCGISGKHHCKCEYEEEVESFNLEKPRRRRSLGKGKPGESSDGCAITNADSVKTLHGKFKEVHLKGRIGECGNAVINKANPAPKWCSITLKSTKRSMQNESSKWMTSDLPIKKKSLKSLTEAANENLSDDKCSAALMTHPNLLPSTENESDSHSELDTDSCSSDDEVWKMEKDTADETEKESSGAPNDSKTSCEKVDTVDGQDKNLEDEWESTSNPFLAAILRTTRKSCPAAASQTYADVIPTECDNSQINFNNSDLHKNQEFKSNSYDYTLDKELDKNGIFLHRLKISGMNMGTKKSHTKTKVVVPDASVNVMRGLSLPSQASRSPMRRRHRANLDLRLDQKKASAVRNLSDFGPEDGPSEFITKNLNRLKSLLDRRDLGTEYEQRSECSQRRIDLEIENSSNNGTKTIPVPSAQEKLKFRRSLDSAAQLVFHRCSGLPLTSSPAPVRRNNSSFSFDSSLNSVSAIKSALFDSSNSVSSEDENESEGSLRSPASPGAWSIATKSINYHSLSPLPLLGTFEESVLNGRLEPVSTVQGFTAELGASGSFCPRHLHLPVTVFFYTLGDNDKVSAPYLGHINLGKKGYNVPRSGTIQVTLFNPMRTVVKMFVVLYDLHDMPPNSHTFLRQRTLYVPANQKESVYFQNKEGPFEQEDYHKYLRYLIHLRFVSGKTGRIYLHTDIRMVIFRKADEDTATALGKQVDGETFELRSHTHGPTNPKFSPRK